MSEKTAFCKSLDWKVKLQWFDKTGIFKYADGRVARIELSTNGVHGEYVGFRTTVLNPREGKVDEKMFLFDDYLDRTGKGRTDGRHEGQQHEYPISPKNRCFMVIDHIGWRWYIAIPKNTKQFCAAVEAYVKAFEG